MNTIISSVNEVTVRSLLIEKDIMEDRLSQIDPSQRILLLSHCMRISKNCQAENLSTGLHCVECSSSCQVNRLKKEALACGYKGVCIAPGGSLALRYVKENKPGGIVAVACHKELIEGLESIKELEPDILLPVIVVPLIKEGCVDTEVDIDLAISKISLGCNGLKKVHKKKNKVKLKR